MFLLSRSTSQRCEQKPDGRWKRRWRDLTNKESNLLTSKRTEIRLSLNSTPGWRSTCSAFQLVLGSTAFWNPLEISVTYQWSKPLRVNDPKHFTWWLAQLFRGVFQKAGYMTYRVCLRLSGRITSAFGFKITGNFKGRADPTYKQSTQAA